MFQNNNKKAPNEYPNWLEETIQDRLIDSKILQLHDKQIDYYSTLRAEDFIENLEKLWETSSRNIPKLTNDLDQDWLYYAIKLCNDKLPPPLPKIDENSLEFTPINSVSFSLYQVELQSNKRIKSNGNFNNFMFFLLRSVNFSMRI